MKGLSRDVLIPLRCNSCQSLCYKRGLALWFVLGLVVVLTLGGIVIFNLTRGLTHQVEYADAAIRAQYIAESAYNQLYARLSTLPWNERWFASAPDSGSLIPLHGGFYDYFIADNPYRPLHADIFVRSEYKNVKRCFYWLVRMKPGLLVSLTQNLPVCSTTEIEPERLPTNAAQHKKLADEMERIIETRHNKQQIGQAIESGIKTNNDVTQAITQLGGAPPAGVVRDPVSTSGGPPTGIPPVTSPPAPANISNGLDPSGGKTTKEEEKLDNEVLPGLVDNYPQFGGVSNFTIDECTKKITDSITKLITLNTSSLFPFPISGPIRPYYKHRDRFKHHHPLLPGGHGGTHGGTHGGGHGGVPDNRKIIPH